jgi:hypothetical protein
MVSNPLQNLKVVTNFILELPASTPAYSFLEVQQVTAPLQSNYDDCGVHALINLRFLAWALLMRTELGAMMPAGENRERDAAWRKHLAAECIAGTTGFSEEALRSLL